MHAVHIHFPSVLWYVCVYNNKVNDENACVDPACIVTQSFMLKQSSDEMNGRNEPFHLRIASA